MLFSNSKHRYIVEQLQAKLNQKDIELANCKKTLTTISELSTKLKAGDFESRITNWDEYGPYSEIMCDLNKFIDLTDAFIRESIASLNSAAEKQYFRTFLPLGMQGVFQDSAKIINSVCQSIQDLESEQKVILNKKADEFESSIMSSVQILNNAILDTKETAGSLINQAKKTQTMSTTVAAAAEQASANVQTVASAVEEMTASTEEISRQVTETSQKTSQTTLEANEASSSMSKLETSSQGIDAVVKLISDVAEQTNLLALNATIEAARAGEAGKGFAVVASEVKSLAQQTATATEEIRGQISEIQGFTTTSLEKVETIGGSVRTLDEISETIASAVVEQNTANQEINRNLVEAQSGTQEVASNIIEVNLTAGETLDHATGLIDVSQNLEAQVEDLQSNAREFLVGLRN